MQQPLLSCFAKEELNLEAESKTMPLFNTSALAL
jgi:hypothetical protein